MNCHRFNRFRCALITSLLATAFAAKSFAQTGPITTNLIPVVTIVATDSTASESGAAGTFTVYRHGSTNNALNVFYLIGGTAANGTDYVALPNTILIPAGVTSVQIQVRPIDDNLVEDDETVTLHLGQPPYLPPVNYAIGTPDTATVIIQDNDGTTTNNPPVVNITGPANGQTFPAPANILITANAFDTGGLVATVEFFEGTHSLGVATNNPMSTSPLNPFHVYWTNVPAGQYLLTAIAKDNAGAAATSAPVNITVKLPPPNTNPPVVTIVATDAIAVEHARSNSFVVSPAAVFTNYYSGTNTATFLVQRTGDTNSSLTVYYSIGGTASNGVDYVALPGNVTIAAGKRFALITIIPLEDIDPVARRFETVILALKPQLTSTATNPPPYLVGWPGKAGAIILEERDLPGPVTGTLPDGSFHVGLPGTNGMNYCVQVSTNLVDWTTICTNTVVKAAIHFIDPEANGHASRYYRTVPVDQPAIY